MNYQMLFLDITVKLMIFLSIFTHGSAAGLNFTVGGESGWDLNSDLETWSASQTFSVGDTVEFVILPGHSMLEVNENSYNSCNTENPISFSNSPSTTVPLTSLGVRYFICGTQGHCNLGMKVKIVIDEIGSAPPSPIGRPNHIPIPSPPSPIVSPPPPTVTELCRDKWGPRTPLVFGSQCKNERVSN